MNEHGPISDSICEEQTHLAERELSAFHQVRFEEPIQMLPRIHKSSIKNGGSDDSFKSNNRAMYRGVLAVLTLVRSMPR
jgi:hypothetical protein